MNTESRKIVRRSFSNYVVSNLPREKLLKFNIQDDLRSKWPWLETLQATRFDFLIEKHTKAKSKNEPIDKKAMGQLFRAMGQKVLPTDFLGSPNTLKIFLQNINRLLLAGKGTSIHVRDLLKGISSTLNPDEAETEKLVLWLAENLFWKIVTSYFHVCLTSSSRHELQYFHKCHFQSACQSHFSTLVKENRLKELTKVQATKIIKSIPGAPKVARVQLKPKSDLSSLRMITRKEKDGTGHTMEATRCLLEEISRRFFQGSIDVKGEMFHKLLSTVIRNRTSNIDEFYYIVITDIKDAFGSINYPQMKKILRELLPKLPTFLYFRTFTFRHTIAKKQLIKKMICDNELDPPMTFDALTFIKENSCQKIEVKKTIEFVLQRMKAQTIQQKFGKARRFYLVKNQGILQGDTLSTALCNIYLGHLTQTYLKQFQEATFKQTLGLFARGVDDFIFICKQKELAEKYLQVMENGFVTDYSCAIQASKTATNFTPRNEKEKLLKFCGAIIDPLTLQCRPNFKAYHHKNVIYASNLAMPFPQSIIHFITTKLLFICTLHLKPLYINEEINGPLVSLENIYEASYLVALKLHSILSSLEEAAIVILKPGPKKQLKILTNRLIGKMMNRYKRIVERCELRKQKNGLRLIKHTMRYAFVAVLHGKFGNYKDLELPWVDYQLVPTVVLNECIKRRETFKIKSKAYFKF